jgi:ATP-binding cassette subfamily B protein
MSNPTNTKKIKLEKAVIGRIFNYVRPYKYFFAVAVFITISLSALAVARPIMIKMTIDKYMMQKDADMLLVMVMLLIGSLVIEAVFQFSNMVITSLIGQNIIRDLRTQVFKHILQFKSTYFDTTPVGMLVTRSVSDVEALADVFSQGFIVIAGDLLMLVTFVVTMFYVNWQFTLIVLLTVPLLLIATRFFQRGVNKTFNEVRNAVAALNTFVQEHIQGMMVVQIFNRQEKELEKFTDINNKHRDANIRSIWYYSIFFPIVEILSSLAIAMLIWYAGIKSGTLKITPGELTFFIMLTNMLFRPIRMLADRVNTLQMGVVAAERVFKVLDTNDSIENKGKIQPNELKGDIQFKDIYFAYQNENWVLNNINLTIKAGECVALVGATGSGKTSITNLIPRFYEYNKGDILLDGTAIRNYELNALRTKIGIVMQDVFLYSDSILNNITLNNPDIKKEEVIAASKLIGAHEFIMNMPGDYDYQVRERGATLSVGQRQLIAFLRAYVHQPSILILDEATSSIDTATENLIQKATEILTKNRTSIIVAHRLATIQHADKVIVLDKGNIIEQGSIDELLKLNGQFKKLYEL